MKFKVESNWGMVVLKSEEGQTTKPRGQLVEYKGCIGRIWAIPDVSSHCGGHGMGNMTSSQAVLATKDMEIIPIETQWQEIYEITLMGYYNMEGQQ